MYDDPELTTQITAQIEKDSVLLKALHANVWQTFHNRTKDNYAWSLAC